MSQTKDDQLIVNLKERIPLFISHVFHVLGPLRDGQVVDDLLLSVVLLIRYKTWLCRSEAILLQKINLKDEMATIPIVMNFSQN